MSGADGIERTPTPWLLIAATRNVTGWPGASPSMFRVAAVDPVSATAVAQLSELSVEISTRYPVTGAPPLSPGDAHDSNTDVTPAMPDRPVGAAGVVTTGTTTAPGTDPSATGCKIAISNDASPMLLVLPCPSRPPSPKPQHLTVPLSSDAHV